jgi:transposase
MDRQILRDWAVRFNAEGPEGLISRKATGAKPKLNAEQLAAVIQLVEQGPVPAVHGVVRWRLVDLAGWIHDEYGVSLDTTRLGRILKSLGYGKLSARPRHHGQNEYALEDFKKTSPPGSKKSETSSPLELKSSSGGRMKPA